MRGSSGPESSSATLVGIRASIRCCSSFLSAARICSLRKENKNTSITATTAPRNVTMVINQIIWARTQTDDSAEPTAKTDIPSLINILGLISYGSAKRTLFPNPSPDVSVAGPFPRQYLTALRSSPMSRIVETSVLKPFVYTAQVIESVPDRSRQNGWM